MELAILLATYNSARYLECQINSLLTQTYNNFTLYVRDDGSTDDTLKIIGRYCETYPNIMLLNDSKKSRGAMDSFMWLLEHVNADYYMFCDHDDIWLPTKIELSLSKIQSIEKSGLAAMVFTNLSVVDENLKIINRSMWDYERLRPDYLSQLKFAVSKNIFTGCTMILNNAAKHASFPVSENALMHDSWIGLRVLATGGSVDYITDPQILYRQHSDNVVGSTAIGRNLNYYLSKIKNLRGMLKKWNDIYVMSDDAVDQKPQFLLYYFWKLYYLIVR